MVCEKRHKFILSTDFLFGKNTKPVSASRTEVKRARFHTETERSCWALRSTEMHSVGLKLGVQLRKTINT